MYCMSLLTFVSHNTPSLNELCHFPSGYTCTQERLYSSEKHLYRQCDKAVHLNNSVYNKFNFHYYFIIFHCVMQCLLVASDIWVFVHVSPHGDVKGCGGVFVETGAAVTQTGQREQSSLKHTDNIAELMGFDNNEDWFHFEGGPCQFDPEFT